MKTLTNDPESLVAGNDSLLGVVFPSSPLLLVSADTGDTSSVLLTGSLGETIVLDGVHPVQTVGSLTYLNTLTLTPAAAGDVSVYLPGQAASFNVVFSCSNVTVGSTLRLGLSYTDSYRTYTFRNSLSTSEITKVTTVADAAGSLAGKHFSIRDNAGSVGVWFKVSGSGAAPGGFARTIEVDITTGASAIAVAAALQAAMDADSAFSAIDSGTGVVTITDAAAGTRVSAADVNTGMTVAVWSAGRAAVSAYEVLIGATAADTASNLVYAITADGAHTSAYSTGTLEHPVLTAEAVDATVMCTDLLAIRRGAGGAEGVTWNNLFTGTGATLSSVRLGSYGTRLLIIPSGVDRIQARYDVSDSTLSGSAFSALASWVSNWVTATNFEKTAGAVFYFALAGVHTGTDWDVEVRYELRPTGTTLNYPGSNSVTVTIDGTDTKLGMLLVPEAAENIRLIVDNTHLSSAGLKIYAGLMMNK